MSLRCYYVTRYHNTLKCTALHSDYEFIFCCSKRSHIILGKLKKFRSIRNNNFIIILMFRPIFIFVILYSCYRHINLWCTVYNNINIDNMKNKYQWKWKQIWTSRFLCYSITVSFKGGTKINRIFEISYKVI